ncbi:Arrestin [Chionoecetes opilio]|uniref:Arrestin n=1 Tax=Chionoecetes opilio TaxID=41210 RepID=A0A8J5CSI8_CHIOP|nr:Arrestin [Chionoecetes opilio]
MRRCRFTNPDHRDKFGIVVSYVARVKLSMGTLGGELAAEVPFTLMNPPLETGDEEAGEAAEAQREEADESTRLVIEECRRLSMSDILDTQKSVDSVDKEDKERGKDDEHVEDVFSKAESASGPQTAPPVE